MRKMILGLAAVTMTVPAVTAPAMAYGRHDRPNYSRYYDGQGRYYGPAWRGRDGLDRRDVISKCMELGVPIVAVESGVQAHDCLVRRLVERIGLGFLGVARGEGNGIVVHAAEAAADEVVRDRGRPAGRHRRPGRHRSGSPRASRGRPSARRSRA